MLSYCLGLRECFKLNWYLASSLKCIINSLILLQQLVWHRNTTETLNWAKATAWLGSGINWGDQHWRLVLEGVRGATYTGDIAVDDIFYTGCYREFTLLNYKYCNKFNY